MRIILIVLLSFGIGLSSLIAEPVFGYTDPGCTNGDCPPDPGCTNGDCPPDPGCTNGDCPPDPGCTNGDCPPYYDDCCCYEKYDQAMNMMKRICCCNNGPKVTCRESYVTDPVVPLHVTISDVFASLETVPADPYGLCVPAWLTVYVGDAWEPLSQNCIWWDRLQNCPMTVDIDIKPGSDPNCFNINGNGVIPVSINGGTRVDVYKIENLSLNFAGLEVGVKGNGNPQCGYEDWNGDGYMDLVCQFLDDPGLWSPGDGVAKLTGKLNDGTSFEGTDTICVLQ